MRRACPCLILSSLALLAGCSVPTTSPERLDARSPSIPHYPGYALVWHDEFNINGPPNPADWVPETGFVRNQEAQWYQLANARCKDGLLVLEARRERARNPNYEPGSNDWQKSREFAEFTSASIKTRGTHEWTFGRWEMRGRIDIRPGLWPAWWTVGIAREWPGCGEIDMMEYFRGVLLANAAWGSAKRWSAAWDDVKVPIDQVARDAGYASADAWAKDFHVWRMDWDKDWIRHYVDGRLMNEIDLSKTINAAPSWAGGQGGGVNPFHEPHHMILNLAIGGTSGGDPSATVFPAKIEIDWVRVYQASEHPPR